MNNILAIAHKELKGYFASPIAYIVIGFSAILFGWFFINLLYYFDRMSMQAGSGFQGPQSVNVNEMLISPLFLNVSVILLFTLPLITMRTYAEEKRSGTIELLLTSPLTDLQIVMGKFLGGLVLYAAMLAVTLVHIGVPVRLRQSRVAAGRDRVSRAAADGRLLPVARPVHLEPHQQPDRRRAWSPLRCS